MRSLAGLYNLHSRKKKNHWIRHWPIECLFTTFRHAMFIEYQIKSNQIVRSKASQQLNRKITNNIMEIGGFFFDSILTLWRYGSSATFSSTIFVASVMIINSRLIIISMLESKIAKNLFNYYSTYTNDIWMGLSLWSHSVDFHIGSVKSIRIELISFIDWDF